MSHAPTYRVSTLGCRVNRADSLTIEKDLAARGFTRAAPGEVPDIWVVNTCAVTGEGMRKSRKLARRCAKSGARVIVTGCGADMDPRAFDITGAETVVPNLGKGDIAREACREAGIAATDATTSSWAPEDLVRVPLKVQEGCERFCTYCIVPYLRPPPSSKTIADVVTEFESLRAKGAGEVILCGIDLGSYREPATGKGLESLVASVCESAGDTWVRLSSIELSDVDRGLVDVMRAGGPVRRHLHVPLQSGDARVLADMGRNYTPQAYSRRVAEVREQVPGVSITTDVMVGFPTEDEEAFEGTRTMLDEIAFFRVHVFKYSPRPRTSASEMGDPVPPDVKDRRAVELRELARANALRFHEGFVGRIIQVLVEATMDSKPGCVFGRAESFAGVMLEGAPHLVGRSVDVLVTGAGSEGLRGTIMSRGNI